MLFIVQEYRNVTYAVAEVPKVTRESATGGDGIVLLPPSGRADQAIGNHAKPEVYDQAYIELERAVGRQWKGGRKEEVGDVAEDDGAQSLQ
jgi:hypothetical protein